MFKSKRAFTLIELLVVIAIIGVLATMSVIALSSVRAKSRDAKRVADVKQMQTALELFFNDLGRYPNVDEWATGKIYSTSSGFISVYMQTIPTAPSPAENGCLESENNYTYIPSESGGSYRIDFCLGGTVGTLSEGMRAGTPSGFVALAQGQFIDEPMAGIGVTYVHEGETFYLTSNAAGYFYVEAKEGSGVTPSQDLNQGAAAVDLPRIDMVQVFQRDASQQKQQVGIVGKLLNAISGIVPVGRGERELIAGDQMTFTAAGVQLGDTIDGSVKFAGDRSGKFQVYPVTLTNDDSLLDDRALTIIQFLQSIKTTEADIVRVDRHPEIATFAQDNDIVALDDNTLAPLVGAGSLNIINRDQAMVATENWALNVRNNVNALDIIMK